MLYLTSFKIAADFLSDFYMFDYKFMFSLYFTKKVLLFQSSTSNWHYRKLGTYEETSSFFTDVFPSANFTGRYIHLSKFGRT